LKRRYGEDKSIKIFRNILQVIEDLHSNKIIHHDIKPSNIMLQKLDNDHEIMLIDFGLACSFEDDEVLNRHAAGTPGYIAPELFEYNSTFDGKSDIFSAGIVF
jgi:serine/threonine protein kinase